MTNDDLVSIIVPVYNREKYIVECVSSALNQTYSNIEIIVTDNDSTDRTWEILTGIAKKDSRVKIFKNEKNLGPVLNWKAALEKAKGIYCKILWSDDLIGETFIADCINLISEDVGFVMSGFQVFDDRTRETLEESDFKDYGVYNSSKYLDDILIRNKNNFPVSPGNALFRLKDLLSVFITDIPNTDNLNFKKYGAGNDLWFFLAIAAKYNKIGILSKKIAFYRSHQQSITLDRAEELVLYYEWAKVYFIETLYHSLRDEYKSKIFISKLKRNTLSSIYRYATGSVKIKFLVKYLFNK